MQLLPGYGKIRIALMAIMACLLLLLAGCDDSESSDEKNAGGPLSGWEGEWISHYSYLDTADADDGFTAMATAIYSAGNVEGAAKDSYYTDFSRILLDDDSITFIGEDLLTEACVGTYTSYGDGTMSGSDAKKFVIADDASEECAPYALLLITPLKHHETGREHIHLRYGAIPEGGDTDALFDELMEGAENENWWPVLSLTSETSSKFVSDYMVEFTDYYRSLLPTQSDWASGTLPNQAISTQTGAVVQQAEYDAAGNLHALFLEQVFDEDSGSVLGYKVVHAVKDIVSEEWTLEDVAADPGSGERGASMAFDSAGTLHVVYGYRAATVANSSLAYLYKDSSGWSEIQWIDGELSDAPMTGYVDSGDRPSIRVASDNTIMVAYSAWKEAVMLATKPSAGSWSVETVELNDDTQEIHTHYGIKLQLDSSDNPHIVYRSSDLALNGSGNAADGHPKVKIVGMDIRYAVNTGSGWTVVSMKDEVASLLSDTSFLVTCGFTLVDDVPYIFSGYDLPATGASTDGILNGVVSISPTGDGGAWEITDVYTQPDAYYGWFEIEAAAGSDNSIHLSFTAQYKIGDEEGTTPGHSLMYGYFNGTNWTVEAAAGGHPEDRHSGSPTTTAPGFKYGNSQAIALDDDDNASIIFRGSYEAGYRVPFTIGGIYLWPND